MKKSQKTRLLLFFLFFGLTGTLLTSQWGLGAGLHTTMLVWSFFVLCFPIPQSALVTTNLISLFSGRLLWYSGVIIWLIALSINIFTYFSMPYAYMRTNTTFLLYRIISNPWPYWLIIGASALGGMYNAIFLKSAKKALLARHIIAKTTLFAVGITTLLYFSYFELVVLLVAKMS